MKGYIKDCSLSLSADSATEVDCTFDLATEGSNTAYGIASANSGNLYCSGVIKANDYAIENITDSLITEIKRIDAQINDLKKNFVPKKECSELRSALKTLHYKREVE